MQVESNIRIILADDHAVVREGITSWLHRDSRVEVVATAIDTQSLADRIAHVPCDVVISDIAMPGINGESNAIGFLRQFLRQPERPRLIVLTMVAQARMFAGLLELGADGLVDKRDCMDSLNAAVAAVIDGDCFVSHHVETLLKSHPDDTPGQPGVLSPREWDVLQLYAGGKTLAGIAEHLGRSVKTISTQRRNALRKLGVETETQLMNYLRQIGLV
ncbi:LuxR family transcriptional regulator [Burkholderia sp. Leaf177]|nr:LuxR family transcriptional regulator [Burkholderia sp. Leaf177]